MQRKILPGLAKSVQKTRQKRSNKSGRIWLGLVRYSQKTTCQNQSQQDAARNMSWFGQVARNLARIIFASNVAKIWPSYAIFGQKHSQKSGQETCKKRILYSKIWPDPARKQLAKHIAKNLARFGQTTCQKCRQKSGQVQPGLARKIQRNVARNFASLISFSQKRTRQNHCEKSAQVWPKKLTRNVVSNSARLYQKTRWKHSQKSSQVRPEYLPET